MADETKGAGTEQENASKTASSQENGKAKSERQDGADKPSDADATLLKENMSMKSELRRLKAAQEKDEKDKLEKSGEYKKLAEKAEESVKTMRARVIQAELKAIALQEGIADLDFIKLADTSKVVIDDNGEVVGAQEVIAALKSAKPMLFGTAAQPQVPGTPKPGATSRTVGTYSTFAEWEKSPEADRYAWAEKNPAAFRDLCDRAKAAVMR